MNRILIVEDDRDIADLISRSLEKAGYRSEIVPSGGHALTRVRQQPPGLIILDLMLPDLDGLEVCRALRNDATTAHVPIIMLTARAEESDRIVGLELGADDYVTKPFSPKELVARVRALQRRVQRPPARERRLQYGPLTVDLERHAVRVQDQEVRLTAKEFLLLQYLMEHAGRVLSRDLLLSEVWGYRYTGGTRTVDVHIRRLRDKIPFLSGAIVTITQFGYKLMDERF